MHLILAFLFFKIDNTLIMPLNFKDNCVKVNYVRQHQKIYLRNQYYNTTGILFELKMNFLS